MLTVRREKDARTDEENYFVEFDPNIPVEILLDTHIWLNMSKAEEQVAQRLRTELCFRFRYSMTNYIELLSGLKFLVQHLYPGHPTWNGRMW